LKNPNRDVRVFIFTGIYNMNQSYSKIRHIQESNKRLDNRLMSESDMVEQIDYLHIDPRERETLIKKLLPSHLTK